MKRWLSMKRWLVLTVLMIAAASVGVAALQWEETGWSATVVSDYDTRLPAIVFNIGLAYDEVPETMKLRIEWQVFSIQSGSRTMLYEYAKKVPERPAVERIYSASQSVLIEAGMQYGAQVLIEDLENGLSVARDFSYFAPQKIPVGLRLVGGDGTELTDFAAMPDEDIQELVRLKQTIDSYDVLAEDVSVESMLSQHARSVEDYPVSVILLPETGVDNNWGTDDQPITVTFGLTVLAFSIPTPSDKADFLEQLERYDQDFTGTVYAGTGGDEFGDGAVIFLHDAMRLVFDGVVEEQTDRLTIDL